MRENTTLNMTEKNIIHDLGKQHLLKHGVLFALRPMNAWLFELFISRCERAKNKCSPHSSGKKAYTFCQDTAIGQQISPTIISLLPYKVHTNSTAHIHAALSKRTDWSGLGKHCTSVQVVSVSFSSVRPSETSAHQLSWLLV